MDGIGNPMFKDPRLEPEPAKLSVNELMNEAKDTVIGMIKDPLARNSSVHIGANPSGMSGGMPRPGGGSYSGPGGSVS